MLSVEEMKSLLSNEYGINSSKELIDAMKRMQKLNVGVFTAQRNGSYKERSN